MGHGAGLGAILRDSNRDAIAAVAGKVTLGTITIHELHGIREGLELALRHNVRHAWNRLDYRPWLHPIKRQKASLESLKNLEPHPQVD
ncbi:hypothetical protein BVC80_379g117 [Macleaya cordata]|uniref:RNase H type-1 domain-containing protein n=1 Tax=Macleaya cordata TaxID=56857 RepID=A0A200QT18_MACCD|nr:hypothetical protein BVC80_379g117 [Macleaya cordata]